MAIFPPDEPDYTDPTFDNLMNYASGGLLIPICILSLFFNALVFHVNLTQQKMGVATSLFLILALSDFLYSVIRTPYVTYNLINPSVKAGVKNEKPNVTQNIVAGLGNLSAYTSICAIFGISIMRFIKLGFPLWAASNQTTTRVLAVVPMVVTVVYSVVLEIMTVCNVFTGYQWTNTAQDVLLGYNSLLLIKMWTVLTPAALSFVLALATIGKLYWDQQQRSEINKYSMVTILLLSVGNIVWTMQWLVTVVIGEKYFFNETTSSIKGAACLIFIFYVFMPCLIALYNPVVLCVRTSKMRAALREIMRFVGIDTCSNGYERLN